MSTNIVTFYVQQYAKVLNELVQQKTSRLRKWCTEDKYVGQAGSPVEQVGPVAMQPVTQRYGPMQRVDAPTNRRWVYPSDYDLPQLFDRFYQSRPTVAPATGEGGRGLGLAIVKRIAELHGGDVTIESTLGRGTRVVLTLPAAPAPRHDEPARP